MSLKKTCSFTLILFLFLTFNLIYFIMPFVSINDPLLASLIFTLSGFALPVVFYLLNNKLSFKHSLNLYKLSFRNLIFTIICTFLILPIANFIGTISEFFFPNNVSYYLDTIVDIPYWKALLMVAVLPAVFEEFAMRGVIFSGFKGYSIHYTAFFNGLFFAMMHFDLQQGMYTFFFGIFLTYLVYYTGSILSAIVSHFVFNATSISLFYFYKNTGKLDDVLETSSDVVTASELFTPAIFTIIIGGIGLFLFKTQIVNKNIPLYEKTKTDIKSIFNIKFFICIWFYLVIMIANYLIFKYGIAI